MGRCAASCTFTYPVIHSELLLVSLESCLSAGGERWRALPTASAAEPCESPAGASSMDKASLAACRQSAHNRREPSPQPAAPSTAAWQPTKPWIYRIRLTYIAHLRLCYQACTSRALPPPTRPAPFFCPAVCSTRCAPLCLDCRDLPLACRPWPTASSRGMRQTVGSAPSLRQSGCIGEPLHLVPASPLQKLSS